MTLPHKLSLTLLNSILILGCVAVMAFVTWATWGDASFAWYVRMTGLGFLWLITGLTVWAFWIAIKATWRE